MPLTRRLFFALCLLVLCNSAGLAKTNALYLVVNAANPIRALTKPEAVALFTGRAGSFPGGFAAEPYDQGNDSVRASFYQALTGMDLARINSYWARLRFSGQIQPPQRIGNDLEMARVIRGNTRAIGYLTAMPNDPALRVVLIVPPP